MTRSLRFAVHRVLSIGLALVAAALFPARSGLGLDDATKRAIDRAVLDVLERTGAPSASVAVVEKGRIAYLQAYGSARLDPPTAARPEMRYSIGSVSKQFTATAILALAEDGKVSLDDPVGRYVPGLTRGGDVTIRQVLSHTSGYQDFWPQDYVPPFMLRETTAREILDRWARKPLDFEPGTEHQYSNTGYVVAGLIVEKASGAPLLDFLEARVFAPLGMKTVTDVDRGRLGENDPVGYARYALGPLRVAPKEGRGWLYAAGELAMSAEDLARWNVGWLNRRLLSPASYLEIETETRLKNGAGTGYGLGVSVGTALGHRALSHGGEVSGFTANNTIFPDDRAAVTVLTNQDSSRAASAIAGRIAPLILEAAGEDAAGFEARARRIFEDLQRGRLDRSLFTEDANSYFTGQVLRDFASSLTPLGPPSAVHLAQTRRRGGMIFRQFEIRWESRNLDVWERDMPDGKIEQFQVLATE